MASKEKKAKIERPFVAVIKWPTDQVNASSAAFAAAEAMERFLEEGVTIDVYKAVSAQEPDVLGEFVETFDAIPQDDGWKIEVRK